LIECKGPNEPIIGARGAVTQDLWKSLDRLSRYLDAFEEGRLPDPRLRIYIENRPRLVLVGCYKTQSDVETRSRLTVLEQEALIEKQLKSSRRWRADYERKLLVVMTWDSLYKRAKEASNKGRVVSASRWCNNLVTWVLGNIAYDKDKAKTYLPSLDNFMERASGLPLGDSAPLVEARAKDVIEALKQLGVSPDRPLDTQSLPSQLQLADWLLYQGNGDMCCGVWSHGSTYPVIDVLEKRPSVWEDIASQLLKALSKDDSVDVLGRTSHVLRYAQGNAKKLLVDDPAMRERWRFPDPEELINDPLRRPDLQNFMQVGYCLALHGVAEAITFMNQAAANRPLLRDLALWDAQHAKEDPEKFMKSLQRKAEQPTEDQKPFLPYHKAICEENEAMIGRLKKAGVIAR